VATRFTASQKLPDTCNGYESIINPCGKDLTIAGSSFSPSSNCCFGSYYCFNLAVLDHGKGIINLCKCLQFAAKTSIQNY